jgi:ABC-type glycerol-3-phosphate transport system substrate-binding protein
VAELGHIGPDAAADLGIAPLPGSRFTFDANGQQVPTEGMTVNRVPYVGWGGRVGVVSATSPNAAAAWDLLADAGLPDRAALDLIADPHWGAGPYRTSQLDSRARGRWYAYGLSAAETERLVNALRDNLGLAIQNYRIRLRTANHADLDAAFDRHLRALLTGPGSGAGAAMRQANQEWAQLIDREPRAEWLGEMRKSLGF